MKDFKDYLRDHDERLIKLRYRALIYNALIQERNEVCKNGDYDFNGQELMDFVLQEYEQLRLG